MESQKFGFQIHGEQRFQLNVERYQAVISTALRCEVLARK
jgi:hypothetical protein